jgi:hypothetical protein
MPALGGLGLHQEISRLHRHADMKNQLSKILPTIFLGVVVLLNPRFAHAVPAAFWDDLVRDFSQAEKSTQIARAGQVSEDMARSGRAREAIEAALKRADQLTPESRAAARLAEVEQILSRVAQQGDSTLLREIRALAPEQREIAAVLARGGQTLASKVPDLRARSLLLANGGADLVAAAGQHGDEFVKESLRFQAALDAGKIASPPGLRAVTLADFGGAMSRGGKASWEFYKNYVRPNWKEWLAGTALAAYILNPEAFQDAAGHVTERGIAEAEKFGGKLLGAVLRGAGEGGKKAVDEVIKGVNGPFGDWRSWVGLAALLFVVSLTIPRLRFFVFWPVRWLWKTPDK